MTKRERLENAIDELNKVGRECDSEDIYELLQKATNFIVGAIQKLDEDGDDS